MRIGLFAGSFNPFTIGHRRVVERVLPLFDRLIIGVGCNSNKQGETSFEERVEQIKRIFASEERVEVKAFQGLTMEFARAENVDFIVKGVRSVRDYEYERDQADANLKLGSIETLLVVAEPELSYVSSTLVRELKSYGKNVDNLLG